VSRQNRKIQMANHFTQAYWSIQTSHFGAASTDYPRRSQSNIPELPEATTFTQNYLAEWHALDPIDNVINEPNPSEFPPYLDVGDGWSKIAIYLFDETGAPGVISEWSLIWSASFQDSKQGEIESLEHLACMVCESNRPYTRLREKINRDSSEVRWTIFHPSHGFLVTDVVYTMDNRKVR
jgi:hypothetical protein